MVAAVTRLPINVVAEFDLAAIAEMSPDFLTPATSTSRSTATASQPGSRTSSSPLPMIDLLVSCDVGSLPVMAQRSRRASS